MNIAASILDVLSREPARAAVREPSGKTTSRGTLRAYAIALAIELRARGFRPGDHAVLQVPNGAALAASVIAVLLAGGVPVLCEPGLGDEVYLSRVRASGARWLLLHPLLRVIRALPPIVSALRKREIFVPPVPSARDGLETVWIADRTLARLASRTSGVGHFEPVDRSPEDDAVLVFTGGTTAVPRGVRLSHGALERYLANIASVIEGAKVESFLADTPQQVLYALRLGKSASTTYGRKKRRAAHVERTIRTGLVDAYFGSPFVFVEMMSAPGALARPLPATLETVLLGSAPVTAEFLGSLRRWLAPTTRIRSIYGLTEAGPVCVVDADTKLAYRGEGDLVGAPLEGVRLSIEPLPGRTDIGEVIVHSDALYTGYLGEPPRGLDEGLRTGDLGRLIDIDGCPQLVLMGRAKDMIVRAGVNVYPACHEPIVRGLRDGRGQPMIRECAMLGVWDSSRQDERIVLCVQPTTGVGMTPDELRERVARVLGPDVLPDDYFVIDPIPVTGRQNKVDKVALRARIAGGG